MIDLTDRVQEVVEASGIQDGICLIQSPHTTAGIAVNEHADRAVAEDVVQALEEIVPRIEWRHLEGNSPAHVKTVLTGMSVCIGIRDGRLALGTWQGVFLCEFDGPRQREVWVACIS